MSHYFINDDSLRSNPKEFDYYFDNEHFIFTTDNGVFSKDNVDYGSCLLIKTVYKKKLGIDYLDLGSGYGPIGIIIKRFNPNINMDAVDINSRAIELLKKNSKLNKVKIDAKICEDILTLNKSYDCVLLNPPIRAGKKVIYELYKKSYEVLRNKGKLYIVIRKMQGADSSFKKLKDIFNEVKVIAKSKGYEIIESIK